jgi:hypothetical protein
MPKTCFSFRVRVRMAKAWVALEKIPQFLAAAQE